MDFIRVEECMLTKDFMQKKEHFTTMEVNNDDVWICSFPKSGTTWTQEMVWLICNNLDFEGAKSDLQERCPFLESGEILNRSLILSLKNELPFVPFYITDSLSYISKLTTKRFIKTHLPWHLLPQQIQNGTKCSKIIYVTRNPKDICVSYYNHSKLHRNYKGSLEEFVDLFLNDKTLYQPYWKHIQYFYQQRNKPNILFLRYEDMKQNLQHEIKRVAEHLCVDLNENQISALARHLDFESMKKNEAVNKATFASLIKKIGFTDHDGLFMRSGKIGTYKETMTPEMIKRIDRWIEAHKVMDYINIVNLES